MSPIVAFGPVSLLALTAAVSMFSRRCDLGLGALGLLLCAGWVAFGLGDPALDSGFTLLSDTWMVDRLSESATLILLVAAAGVAVTAPAPTDGRAEPLLLFGVVGGVVALHGGDLVVLWVGLELVAMAGIGLLLSEGRGPVRARLDGVLVPFMVLSALSLIAVAFLYAGLSTTRLTGVAGRTSTVFTHWGAVQRYVGLLAESGEVPPGLAAQARGKVVEGLAPAAMFMPGMLLLLAVLLARSGVLPFPGTSREVFERGSAHTGVYHFVVGPLVAVAVLLRLYVGAWHAPRLVSEPYGWTGVLPLLAVLTMGVGAVHVLRARNPTWMVLRSGTVIVGEVLLLAVASASMHGRGRHMEIGTLDAEAMVDWARRAGDDATAAMLAALAVMVVATVGALAAISAATEPTRRGFAALQGFGYRRPAVAGALMVCLCTLAGAPMTAGFPTQVIALRSLAFHEHLAFTVFAVALGLAAVAAGTVRVGWVMMSRQPAAPPPAPGLRTSLASGVALVAASTCLLMGLQPDPLIRFARTQTAGLTIPIGSEARANWARGPR